ncbi:MAG: hypothetical protein U1E28_22090 [Beijerinckiaceae bacterium]
MSAEQRIASSCVRLMAVIALVAAAASPAAAQQAPKVKAKSTDDPFTVMSRWKPTADAPDMPDFVKKSRPDGQMDYAPVTGDEPARPKRMSPAELAAATSKMDAAAAAARARAAAAFPANKARRPASAE